MNIDAIRNGIVIDHIRAGKAMEIYKLLNLEALDCSVAIIKNAPSELMGKKDIIKIDRALAVDLDALGYKMCIRDRMNYGTILVSLADRDKEEALPLVRRFYNLGFNIEATSGTAAFLKSHGIRTRVKKKISDGSEEILDSIRQGYVSYVINTRDMNSLDQLSDGYEIRRCAVENNVTMFTALDTVQVLLDVLEETTLTISTIDA